MHSQRGRVECVLNTSKASLMWNLTGPLAKPDSKAVVSLINHTHSGPLCTGLLCLSLSNSPFTTAFTISNDVFSVCV